MVRGNSKHAVCVTDDLSTRKLGIVGGSFIFFCIRVTVLPSSCLWVEHSAKLVTFRQNLLYLEFQSLPVDGLDPSPLLKSRTYNPLSQQADQYGLCSSSRTGTRH